MSNKVAKSIFLILVLSLGGCSAFSANVYVPLKHVKIAIEQDDFRPNVIHGGDGVISSSITNENKAITYHMELQRQGIESRVVYGIRSVYSKPVFQCWNEVLCPKDGKWKLVDVNSLAGQDGWDVEQYPEYLPYLKFKGEVTNQNIRLEKGHCWKSDKAISELRKNCQVNWIPIVSEIHFIF